MRLVGKGGNILHVVPNIFADYCRNVASIPSAIIFYAAYDYNTVALFWVGFKIHQK